MLFTARPPFKRTAASGSEARTDMDDEIDEITDTENNNVISLASGKPDKLTAKQAHFSRLCAFGGEDGRGLSQSEAYRRAYSAEKMSDHAVWTEASRLFLNPVVARRIGALKARQEGAALRSGLSLRQHIQRTLYHLTEQGENDAAKLRACELLGKLTDVAAFTDRVEQIAADVSPEEVQHELVERLKKAFGE